MKKKNVLIIMLIIILLLLTSIIYYSKKIHKNNNYKLNYGIVFNSSKNTQIYFLYSTNNKIYYTNGYNPENIFIVTSNQNYIDKNIINMAEEELKENNFTFNYNNNQITITNIVKSVYSHYPTIDDLKLQLDIIEKNNSYSQYNYDSVICEKVEENTLYYTDKYGINIYLENIKNIYVIYNNQKYELKEILLKNDDLSDNIYYFFKNQPDTITGSNWFENNTLEGISNNDIRITRDFNNNQLYYTIKCNKYLFDNYIEK